jgi:NitT/TauT family transport system ATP-binding protein
MDLIVEGVTHGYGDLPVLADVSLTVAAGEVVALVGPSGCWG